MQKAFSRDKMFRYGISCALEDLPESQPVTLRGRIDEVCRIAKKIGYDAIELHIREPARYNTAEILEIAGDHGLVICAVANGMEYTVNGLSLIDDDTKKRAAALDRIYEHADFAAALGAKLIVGIMRGNIRRGGERSEYLKIFSEALDKICERAGKTGTPVVLESILRYINNYLCNIHETMDFITSQNIGNLSLHIDTHSMAIEEQNMRESILYCKNKPLGYVHYSDNNRRYPGGGALDFRAITGALAEIGYSGFITVECLPWPDAEESARRALEYIRAVEKMSVIENFNTEKLNK